MAEKDTVFEVPEREPGVLIGTEVSYKPKIELSPKEQTALKNLCEKLNNRDMSAWRELIIRVWEKRLFDRGYQHLLPLRGGGWEIPPLATGWGTSNSPTDDSSTERSIFELNIYNSYQQILTSVLTREVPTVRFEPNNRDQDADINSAEQAEKLKLAIVRDNLMVSHQADLARFLYTDGYAVVLTQYIKDGQRFGYDDPATEAEEEETVPETEERTSEEESAQGIDSDTTEAVPEGSAETETDQEENEAENPAEIGTPRGREQFKVGGALEWKFPIKSKELSKCGYALHSEEIDVAIARAEFPDVAAKIMPSQGAPGGDDVGRLARINVNLGMLNNFQTTDSQAYDVTKQILWLRPAQLLSITDQECMVSLVEKAGKDGLRVIFCGEQFCECRAISMDDQVTLIHALPGDGMHRPGLGDWVFTIQKVLNNWIELADDYLVRGVPNKWMDNDMFNLEAIKDQDNLPGEIHPFDREPGVTMDQVIWEETPLDFPDHLWQLIQFFFEAAPQLLCGAFPALSGGGDSSPTDTYGGMLVQRDQAIGRIGVPWRNIKQGMACLMRQAVMALAHNHKGAINVPGSEAVRVEMEDLKGNILAFPQTDENFPESPTAKTNRLVQLVTDAANNPLFAQILDTADNLEIVKDGIGLEDLVLPQLESRDKQLGESMLLLEGGPTPNPQYAEIEQQIATITQGMQAAATMDPNLVQAAQAQLAQLQQQLQGIPPEISSVPVDETDDHAVESATILRQIRSPLGRELRRGTADQQAAFDNWKLHYKEHIAALKQQQAGQTPNGKPPSVSIALKDLPPNEAAAAATMAGIPAKAADFKEQEVADAATKHPGQITT